MTGDEIAGRHDRPPACDAAVLAPPIRVRHPLGSAVGLCRSRWFSVGWMVAIVAWGLHVGALSLAPLSIVSAVLSGGSSSSPCSLSVS